MRNSNFFGGVQWVPGVGWVQPSDTGGSALSGEADIAMVSGLG